MRFGWLRSELSRILYLLPRKILTLIILIKDLDLRKRYTSILGCWIGCPRLGLWVAQFVHPMPKKSKIFFKNNWSSKSAPKFPLTNWVVRLCRENFFKKIFNFEHLCPQRFRLCPPQKLSRDSHMGPEILYIHLKERIFLDF